jgi:triosephosphate isomerase (TIM)
MPPLMVGNWKMNGSVVGCTELAQATAGLLKRQSTHAEVALAPPFTALCSVAKALQGNDVKLAAQNCHWEESGAFTGEVSVAMLDEIGCRYVIVGHSERRHLFHESDEMVGRKVMAVLNHGLRPILCVGETLAQRQGGDTLRVVVGQLDCALKGLAKSVIDNLEIAYEPVWAIGTGQNATAEQVDHVHSSIRNYLRNQFGNPAGEAIRILYGGSVKPDNAAMLASITEVNGLLVGGASLNAESFVAVIQGFSAVN